MTKLLLFVTAAISLCAQTKIGGPRIINGTTMPRVVNCGNFSTAQLDTLSTDGGTYSTFASTDITNTEGAFAKTCTIPANTFVAGTYVQFLALVAYTTSATAPSRQYRVRLTNVSGTIVIDTTALAPPNNLT